MDPKRQAEGRRHGVTQTPTQATEEILDHESPRPGSNSIISQRDLENSAKPGHSGRVSQVPGGALQAEGAEHAKAPRRWPCYNRGSSKRSMRLEEREGRRVRRSEKSWGWQVTKGLVRLKFHPARFPFFFKRFIEIPFMYHIIHPFKVFNSRGFGTLLIF